MIFNISLFFGTATTGEGDRAGNSNSRTAAIRNTLAKKTGETITVINNPLGIKIQLPIQENGSHGNHSKTRKERQFKVKDKIFSSQTVREKNNLFFLT
jgi:hypothetical protein